MDEGEADPTDAVAEIRTIRKAAETEAGPAHVDGTTTW